MRVDAVVAMVGADGGLGETLGLVVDRARADRVDVAPVGFYLGVDFGVAVALRGRGVEVAGVVLAGEIEGVDGAGGTDEEGFDAEAGVVDRTSGRGEVKDLIDRAGVEGLADVLLDEAEAGLVREVSEVSVAAGREVVDADNGMAFGEEGVTKVRA